MAIYEQTFDRRQEGAYANMNELQIAISDGRTTVARLRADADAFEHDLDRWQATFSVDPVPQDAVSENKDVAPTQSSTQAVPT